jgi:hypothetical protein
MNLSTAEHYRERAAQARRLADETFDQPTCDDLRELAEEYELEARELEAQARKSRRGH